MGAKIASYGAIVPSGQFKHSSLNLTNISLAQCHEQPPRASVGWAGAAGDGDPALHLHTACSLRNTLESGGVSQLLPDMQEAGELASLVAALGGEARVEQVEQEELLEPLLFSCGSVVTLDPVTGLLQVQGSEVHSTTHYLVVTTLQCSVVQ